MGNEGLQSITTASPTSGSIAGMPDEVTSVPASKSIGRATNSANAAIGLEVM
jgi:hypothetical protein